MCVIYRYVEALVESSELVNVKASQVKQACEMDTPRVAVSYSLGRGTGYWLVNPRKCLPLNHILRLTGFGPVAACSRVEGGLRLCVAVLLQRKPWAGITTVH